MLAGCTEAQWGFELNANNWHANIPTVTVLTR